MSNKIFGDYTVVDNETYRNTDGRLMLHVQCACGKVEFKPERNLKSGRCVSCKVCSAKRTAKKFPPPVRMTGCGGLSGTHYLSIKSGASKRGIEFNLSPEFLWQLYENQKGFCALTDVPIVLVKKINKTNPDWSIITASLDRKDSTLGYLEDNVWWVHKRVNRLKNNYSLEELLYWSNLLLRKHGNPDPSLSGNTLEGATTRDRDLRVSNIPTSAQLP